MSLQKMIPLLSGTSSFISASIIGPASDLSFFSTWGLAPERESSSATKEVVTLTSGNIAILDIWLKSAMATPTAASSTGPVDMNQ